MPDAPLTPPATNSQTPRPDPIKLGKPNIGIDFRNLANSMVTNKQWHLPPNDITRLGEVVGYDPNYVTDDPTAPTAYYDYPTVSVTMAGDDTPMHGFRFMEHYQPTIGDIVWVQISGEDGFVVGKLSGAYNTVAQATAGNSPTTLLGHVVLPASPPQVFTITNNDPGAGYTIPAVSGTIGLTLPFNVLPNRKYRYELAYTIIADVKAVSGSLVIVENTLAFSLTPTLSTTYGSPVTANFSNNWLATTSERTFTNSGSVVGYWSYSPSAPIQPGDWTTWFPNNQVVLGAAVTLNATGVVETANDPLGKVTVSALDFAVYDCGLAS